LSCQRRTSTMKMKILGCEMHGQRGRLTGVGAAMQRLRTAERILADARANPKALHHFSRLEDDVAEAKRLVEVAKDRAAASPWLRGLLVFSQGPNRNLT